MARLGDIATYINGYAFKPSDWSDTGIPIIRIQDLTGNSYQANRYSGQYDKKYEVNCGDVLISWSASLGVYVWGGEKSVLNQHIFKVVFDKQAVNKSFFVHQVQSVLENAASQAHGATMKHLTKPVFDSLPFYLPSMEQQRHIATVLDKITYLITLRQQQLAKLDELVKARFVEMFGDFNETSLLSTVATVTGGLTKNSKRDNLSLKLPYLRVANVFFDNIDITEVLEIGLTLEERDKTLLRFGDLLFVEGNGSPDQIGRVAIWRDEISPCVHQNHLIKARFDKSKMLPIYAMYYFMSPKGREQIKEKAVSTSGLYTLSVSKIETLLLPIPPIDTQKQFSTFTEQIRKQKLTIQQSLDKLEMLKRALMQEYFG